MLYLRICLLGLTFALHSCSDECAVIPNESSTSIRPVVGAGHVYNIQTGERVQGAHVSIFGSSETTLTDSLGRFRFADLEAGTYTFNIQKDDLGANRSQPMMFGGGDSVYLALPLVPVTGGWQLSIAWDGYGSYDSYFRLNEDRSVRWITDQGIVGGTWSLRKDSISVDFSNGTMLDGILADSMSGTVDQKSFTVNGVFVATR